MAGFLWGLGKAGTDILGGVVQGAGKAVETVGEAAGTGIVGGVVKGAGKAVETTGKATVDVGEALFGHREVKPKTPKEDKSTTQKDHKLVDAAAKEEDETKGAEKTLAKPTSEEGAAMESDDKEEPKETKAIPKHFSLKSNHNNRYLRYTNDYENSNGLLRYSGNIIVSPYSKFATQASKSEKGLVHIRCCYNNKLWVRLSEHSNYIAAIADEEEENKSKWSCTLFEPIFVSEQNAYCFRHVQLDSFLRIAESDPTPYKDSLAARVEDFTNVDDSLVLSVAVDWDSIFILPKYVAFKGHNGKYLEPSHKYLKFSASSVEDTTVTFEIISKEDGYIHIKHIDSGKYWIRQPNWIHCQPINTKKDDPNALFWPEKVDINFVALRNKGNNRFCKSLTADGKTNCLNADDLNITDTTSLEVIDVVIVRNIENVEYHLNDARIYDKKIRSVYEETAINNTEVEDKVTFAFKCEKKVERTWSSSVSTAVGILTKFAPKVPTIGKFKFEHSSEGSSENSWEETKTEKWFEEIKETVPIAPMSKVKYTAMITEASCDVPFSYTRRDTLQDGQQVHHRCEDGLFSGLTTFDYKFEIERLPL